MPLPRCPPGFSDHVFKRVHGLQLPLRYWPPRAVTGASSPQSTSNGSAVPAADAAAAANAPWLLWVHGGGYTCGKWAHPTPWLLPAFERYGLVSVGYRLQPEASLADMTDDVVDAYRFARQVLGVSGRCVVGGASAGTTVAALATQRLLRSERSEPNQHHEPGGPSDSEGPAAFLSVYGLLDTHAYLLQERAAPKDPTPSYLVSTDAELAEVYANPSPQDASTQNPWAEEMPPHVPLCEIRAHLGLPDYAPSEKELRRVDLYSYAAAHGNLVESVCRRSGFGTDAAFVDRVKRLSPRHVLDHGGGFVPTFLMHGLADDVVPASHSREFAARLREAGVPTHEVYVEGAGHVYDFGFEAPGDAGWDESVGPCLRFLDEHVGLSVDGDGEQRDQKYTTENQT